jgi:DNA (cytosine-5)-methyltransferase 1
MDFESETFVTQCIPIDMRQASRGETMTNNRAPDLSSGGAPGTGIGKDGDPSPSLANSHTPAIAVTVGFYANESGNDAAENIAPTLRSMGKGGQNSPAIAFSCKDSGADATEETAPTLRSMNFDKSHANAGGQAAIAFNLRGREDGAQAEVSDVASLRSASGGSSRSYTATEFAVRRLTVEECESLQGFSRGYTNVPYRGKPAADGPRYAAIGNAMAVPVMLWIGQRIAAVDAIIRDREEKEKAA